MNGSASPHKASDELESRVITAAYACFERFGISKTTVEDIARGAKLSRQTIYRYFSGKDDILDTICCQEAERINLVVRNKIKRNSDFASILTDALFIIITEGSKSAILRQIVDVPSFQALASSASSRSHQLNLR